MVLRSWVYYHLRDLTKMIGTKKMGSRCSPENYSLKPLNNLITNTFMMKTYNYFFKRLSIACRRLRPKSGCTKETCTQ